MDQLTLYKIYNRVTIWRSAKGKRKRNTGTIFRQRLIWRLGAATSLIAIRRAGVDVEVCNALDTITRQRAGAMWNNP